MFRLNNIKQNILTVTIAALLTGCGGGGGSSDSTTETTITEKVVSVPVNAILVTEDSATIDITAWIESGYTVVEVIYGTTNKYGSTILVEENPITLYNLQANTTYHYKIIAKDNRDKKIVSRDQTFTTLEQTTQPIVTEPAPTEPTTEEIAPTEPTTEETAPTEPTTEETAPTEPTTEEPAPTEPTTEPIPICQSGPAMQQGQVIDSTTGTGIADVTVTISGCSTQTDADGYYMLSNIVVNDEAVVNFEKEGYLLASTKIQIKELLQENTTSSNYLEHTMYAHDYNWNYDSTGEILSSRISVDTSVAYMDTDGNPYSGMITAELTILDPGEEALLPTFPGGFKGINTNGEMVQFESYGLISLSLKDSNKNTISLADNEIATLVFKAISSTEEQTTIPLWYFDDGQNTWIEDGYAELQADGTYKGEISHLGIWSLSQPIEVDPGIYTDRILYPDGTPVKNLRVHAVGENWISNDLSTDENGEFEIEVVPGREFTLKAYHYEDKYSAIYNGLISAVTSGEIVNNSEL